MVSKLALIKVRDLVCISACIWSLKCNVYILANFVPPLLKNPPLKKKKFWAFEKDQINICFKVFLLNGTYLSVAWMNSFQEIV